MSPFLDAHLWDRQRSGVAATSQRGNRPASALMLALAAIAAAAALVPAQASAEIPAYTVTTVPAPQPQASSNFGERLRAIGNIDGDGTRDVLMSSSNYDGDDGNGGVLANSGRVYLFSGRTGALLRAIEPPFPQANAKFGFWDANLGDVNGDGTSDYAISASSQVIGGATLGQVYVYSGRDRKSTRLNSSHEVPSRMPSSA